MYAGDEHYSDDITSGYVPVGDRWRSSDDYDNEDVEITYPIIDSKRIDQMGDEYMLIQVDSDVRATIESIGFDPDHEDLVDYGGLFVLMGDAEYLEVWAYNGTVPWNYKMVERIY